MRDIKFQKVWFLMAKLPLFLVILSGKAKKYVCYKIWSYNINTPINMKKGRIYKLYPTNKKI